MPRKAWISTIAFQRSGKPATIEQNVARARQLLEQAASTRPDIICLPETFAYVGVPHRAADVAEPVPGPLTDMAGDVARRHGTYVICPLLERRGEVVHNTAVLIDRRSHICGKYEKVHPVTSSDDFTELEGGVTPGNEPKVFETDFGRIGILICFDLIYAQVWARMRDLGAEIVFWPSAYNGGFRLRVFAALHRYFVVSSVQGPFARIIDISGEVLAETDRFSAIASAQIDLEKGIYHANYSVVQIPAIRARYGRDVRVRTYGDEGYMTVESLRDDLTVAQIEAEFGLEPYDIYRARNKALQDALRAGETPVPQTTAYPGRRKNV